MTPAQRLAPEATEAAEGRQRQTHPDVVALQVERTRALVDRLMWAAWLLDPTIAAGLLGILIAERRVAPGRIVLEPVARVAKWTLLATTYVMNTWESWAQGSVAGVVLHSVPPVVVFVLAEVMPGLHDKLTEYVDRAVTRARERVSGQGGTATPAFPAVPCGQRPATLRPPFTVAAPLNGVGGHERTISATGPLPPSGPWRGIRHLGHRPSPGRCR